MRRRPVSDVAATEAARVGGPIRAGARNPVHRDPVARRRLPGQRGGAARAAQDPEPQQRAARVHVALPVHHGLPDAGLQPVPVRRVPDPSRRDHRPVGVQAPRRPAVPWPVHLLRDIRHGRRTLDGSHQTAFLPRGT